MSIYNLGKNRMLCWDDFLIDKIAGAEVRMHKPVKREKVITLDKSWEGNVCGYPSIIKLGDTYRMYYRAQNLVLKSDGSYEHNQGCHCIAESKDLKVFERLPINKYERDGEYSNNIFLDEKRDNFAIFYDKNPACPENEKFKALSMGSRKEIYGEGLYLYVSADGIDFTLKEKLPIPGTFDSYNVMFWDEEAELYRFFYRSENNPESIEYEFDVVNKVRSIFRTVNTSTSKDLVTFEHHGEINYGEDNIPMQFYTNNVVRYPRAKDMFIGFPMRYIDRWADDGNFEHLPLAEKHMFFAEKNNREGTAFTDCAVITSRDGYNFNKWDEAYLTPGIENPSNWWYGNCLMAYGIFETPADEEGAPNEISMISPENYRIKPIDYYRYTTRLDGFFSWYAKYRGGEILTKPFTFEGNELEINFSSSAFGDVTVTVCDETGNELDGYKSIKIFGDSTSRKVRFEKDLKLLENSPVRLKFELHDTDLYSFKFN